MTDRGGPVVSPIHGASGARVLGHVRGADRGPTLVAISGLHGNEPAGIWAVNRVLERIDAIEADLRGELLVLAGNLAALAERRRYMHEDLNRLWLPGRIREARYGPPAGGAIEDRELGELLRELEAFLEDAGSETYIIDLHTTSSLSAPFATIEDTLRNRAFALRFPVPVVLGLEEYLDGTLLGYLNRLGHVTLGFEAGQHDSPEAIDNAEAALWIALESTRIVEPGALPEVDRARARLARATRSLPPVLEVRHRHGIEPDDGFRMEAGYVNFQPVRKGEMLARDRHGKIRAPENGRILLPLYQELGDDGFFIVREFRSLWLTVSWLLRRMKLDTLAHLLPGVRRHPKRSDTMIIRRRRWFTLPVLHLLGYRRVRVSGDDVVVSRRLHDH